MLCCQIVTMAKIEAVCPLGSPPSNQARPLQNILSYLVFHVNLWFFNYSITKLYL